jgi:hypothetical protein
MLDAIPLDFDIVMPAAALPDAIGKALAAMSRVVFARARQADRDAVARSSCGCPL